MPRWSPYVPVAKRRANAAKQLSKGRRVGEAYSPVVISGRTIASSFWGKAWCSAMESYGDYANRLPRGRTYVRNGSVVDLRVEPGLVSASVSGTRLYRTTVRVAPLSPERWRAVVERYASQVGSVVDLLQGRLPTALLHALGDRSSGLFPGPSELKFDCTCPDWAEMCKHVAAVLYGVGARLDEDPGLFFLLRGVDVADLAARGTTVGLATNAGPDDLAGEDLGSLFGIELASEPVVVAPPASPVPAPDRPTEKPRPARIPGAWLAESVLKQRGVDPGTMQAWLAEGVILPGEKPGTFELTVETTPRLLAFLSARPGKPSRV